MTMHIPCHFYLLQIAQNEVYSRSFDVKHFKPFFFFPGLMLEQWENRCVRDTGQRMQKPKSCFDVATSFCGESKFLVIRFAFLLMY